MKKKKEKYIFNKWSPNKFLMKCPKNVQKVRNSKNLNPVKKKNKKII